MNRQFSTASLSFPLFLVSLLVGAMRFFRLGDMELNRKLLESCGWAFGFFVVGMIGLKMLAAVLSSAPPPRSRSSSDSASNPGINVRPEDLMAIESEMLELEKPEVSGVKGQPPAELAKVISSFSQADKA